MFSHASRGMRVTSGAAQTKMAPVQDNRRHHHGSGKNTPHPSGIKGQGLFLRRRRGFHQGMELVLQGIDLVLTLLDLRQLFRRQDIVDLDLELQTLRLTLLVQGIKLLLHRGQAGLIHGAWRGQQSAQLPVQGAFLLHVRAEIRVVAMHQGRQLLMLCRCQGDSVQGKDMSMMGTMRIATFTRRRRRWGIVRQRRMPNRSGQSGHDGSSEKHFLHHFLTMS